MTALAASWLSPSGRTSWALQPVTVDNVFFVDNRYYEKNPMGEQLIIMVQDLLLAVLEVFIGTTVSKI